MNHSVVALFVVGIVLLVSSVVSVYVQHLRRSLFVELQELQRERDALQVEWGQLELEQSTWATHDRVERTALNRLELRRPTGDAVVLVTP